MIRVDDHRAVAFPAQVTVNAHQDLSGNDRIQTRCDDADHFAFFGLQSRKDIRLIIIFFNDRGNALSCFFFDITAVEIAGNCTFTDTTEFGYFFHGYLIRFTHALSLLDLSNMITQENS